MSLTVQHDTFNSTLSLNPLVVILKKMIKEGKPGARRLYQALIDDLEARPELLQPMAEISLLEKEADLVESVLSTIFPPSTTSGEGIYAITLPFRPEVVYTSPLFRKEFLERPDTGLNLQNMLNQDEVQETLQKMAYGLILQTFYGLPPMNGHYGIHAHTDETNGLTQYYELHFNSQFIVVKTTDPNYRVPSDFNPQRSLELEELQKLLPLKEFRFEGLAVVEITDVTQQQVITEIKNLLLTINSFGDETIFEGLQQHLRSLLGLSNVKLGITPFFKSNEYDLFAEGLYKNSLLFRNPRAEQDKNAVNRLCRNIFRRHDAALFDEDLSTTEDQLQPDLMRYYSEVGAASAILYPLKKGNDLVGLLEVIAETPDTLHYPHLGKLQPSVPLFTLAMEKSNENLETQINRMIKEHFTAIQPAVEWKFTAAAFEYIQLKQQNELAKMPSISFEDVYPLYAAIDIRNSSTERNKSIQKDLLEQLHMAASVLERANKVVDFPLLKETLYRLEKYIQSVSETLLSDEEAMIYDFLETDLNPIFQNLSQSRPELSKYIQEYQDAIDPQRKLVYHHRKDYEDSLTRINDVLDRFIDSEQVEAQDVYPHYFERYVTDGIEFNIYIGQAISPARPFDELYVRNLKLWQLTLLANAARITHHMEKKLPLPLQTTQLILAHSLPLSISFRRKERKFDVDGAYNIRYEIIKKRIDKVHLKDSDERLTQPGTIAIVYSQQKELVEYTEYIEFLQAKGLLTDVVEYHELEDTQGISGLKGIRVGIRFEEEKKKEHENAPSNQQTTGS